jgi:ferredoxin
VESFADEVVLDRAGLDALLSALVRRGYRCVGPTVRDGAIVYDEIRGTADLPEGWTDEQEAGRYRLRRRDDAALFGYAVGPQSWKKLLFPPEERLWSIRRGPGGFQRTDAPPPAERLAFIGVRACELAALKVQDVVFTGGPFVEPGYQARRAASFVVAVHCVEPGGTCFCVSMGTGPRASAGFDLSLTEIIDPAGQRFVASAGTPGGQEILDELAGRPATAADRAQVDDALARAAARMGRTMPADARGLLARNLESGRWDEVATRCLSCANCTLACPTCFCSSVEDVSDLSGAAERWRRWDSCFNTGFSYLHGGEVRGSIRARYRQWISHKLSTWFEQFGSSGCVGCGRCITWCPVGIDITKEVAALARDEARGRRA